jgi:hypothetical protein
MNWGKTLPGTPGGVVQFRSAGPDIVWSGTQQALMRVWATLRGGKTLPAWTDLVTDDLHAQRDTLMSLDLVDDDGAARFRIDTLGQRIVKGFGGDPSGRFLDEVIPPPWRDNAMKTYQAAIERELPIYNVVDTLDRQGTLVRLERLLLPFAGDGLDAEHVLASIETSSIVGTFDEGELDGAPYGDDSCAVVAVITF